MKMSRKMWIIIVLGEIILLLGVYFVMRFGFSIDLLDRSGWKTRNGEVRYLDYYGRPLQKWQDIEGNRYYFAPEEGTMVTGWRNIAGDRYFFDENGVVVTGWLETDNGKFYLEDSGKMVKGLYQLDGKQYLFGDDGKCLTGWQTVDGVRYCFDEAGAAYSGWKTLEKRKYYFTDAGTPVTGWQEIGAKRYCFAEDGSMLVGWQTIGGSTYYLNTNGSMHTGWLQLANKKYYFAADGKMQTGWLTWANDRYYLQKDGSMAVGEVVIDGVSSFFTSAGKYVLLTNCWHKIPDDFKLDLVELGDFLVDRSCRDALEQMIKDCEAAGYSCEIDNTYRSEQAQQEIWDERIAQYMAEGYSYEDAYANVGLSVALVGHSEHHTGLAVDISGSDAMFEWLGENCWDYGFILRYLDGTTEWTGIIYEPWHFRYVGKELALELKELGLCMEEYMDILTKAKGK